MCVYVCNALLLPSLPTPYLSSHKTEFSLPKQPQESLLLRLVSFTVYYLCKFYGEITGNWLPERPVKLLYECDRGEGSSVAA